MRGRTIVTRWLALAACVALAGCGGKSLAPVRGKVTFQGKPVTAGGIQFAPQGEKDDTLEVGRPAMGNLDANGEFTLTTNSPGDGAWVGKHRVFYRAPPRPESRDPAQLAQEKAMYEKYGSLRLPQDLVFEVKPGNNAPTFELIR